MPNALATRPADWSSNWRYSRGTYSSRTPASRKNLPTCHQYIRRKTQLPNSCDTSRATFLTTGQTIDPDGAGPAWETPIADPRLLLTTGF